MSIVLLFVILMYLFLGWLQSDGKFREKPEESYHAPCVLKYDNCMNKCTQVSDNIWEKCKANCTLNLNTCRALFPKK